MNLWGSGQGLAVEQHFKGRPLPFGGKDLDGEDLQHTQSGADRGTSIPTASWMFCCSASGQPTHGKVN